MEDFYKEVTRIMADLPKSITEQTAANVCAAFCSDWGSVFKFGSHNAINGQGTMTFIRYRGCCFGITNEHVVQKYLDVSQQQLFVALRHHRPLLRPPIVRSTRGNPDFPFDIAIFRVNENMIKDGGKVPIELDPEPCNDIEGSQGLAVGFPGIERHLKGEEIMAHPLYHVVAECVSASDRQIVLYQKLVPPSDRPIRFGGMSGGPIFMLDDNGGVSFCGILFEGKGFEDADDGYRGEEIWVYGFPLCGRTLDTAFELFDVRL